MIAVGGGGSLAAQRIAHLDQVSRKRALSDTESHELERAMRDEGRNQRRDYRRAQAAPAPPKRGKK